MNLILFFTSLIKEIVQEEFDKQKENISSIRENIKFTSEKETSNKLSFLDIEMSRGKNQFITSVYRKPTFSGVNST